MKTVPARKSLLVASLLKHTRRERYAEVRQQLLEMILRNELQRRLAAPDQPRQQS